MTAQPCSLWLIPSGAVYTELAALISRLSRSYGTPSFEPHVTLLSGIALAEPLLFAKTQQLAELISPFQVKLTTVDYQDEYFRCLFIRADPDGALRQANATAKVLFERPEEPPYMPHLSLLYGDLPQAKKEEIIAEWGSTFALEFTVDALYLISATADRPVADWRRIARMVVSQRAA